MSAAQLYRQTQLGECLVDALDELITDEKLTPELAIRILSEYDSVSQCRTKVAEILYYSWE